MDKLTSDIPLSIIEETDIPEIPLYMDQVTSFLDERLLGSMSSEDDTVLSKTMINNYVKSGVIEKPIKKKYSKSQLMKMIMVFHLKGVLPLASIKALFGWLENSPEYGDIKSVYCLFVSLQKKMIQEWKEQEIAWETATMEDMLTMMIRADLYKKIARRNVDSRQKK